jgi:hypothetical protein
LDDHDDETMRRLSLLAVIGVLLLTGCARWQPLPSQECDDPPIGCFRRDEPVIIPW